MKAREWMIATLVTSLSTSPLGLSRAWAQEDFPPPPDFSDFPPPPSDFSGGATGGSGQTAQAGGKAAEGSGALSKSQQEKFNRAGIEDITNENFPEMIDSFDFPNVDITDIVKTISELTGRNFIIDPGVRGKITIIAPSKLTVAEAYKAFLSALAINGYTVVPSGSFMKIKNARNAQRDSIETYSGSYYPNDDQMITRIIHLKHISAELVNRELRILPSKDGEMSIYSPTNSIILSDYGSNIDRVMKIINQLDVPGFEEQIDVVPVKYAKAKDMAELVDKIVNKGQRQGNTPQGTFSSGVPRFTRNAGSQGAQGQSGNSFFMAIPDDRTNSIIIVGNKSGIARVKKLLSQLDFRIRPGDSGGVYVYYVKFGDAEKIAQVLQGVTKDNAPRPASGGAGNAFPVSAFAGGAPAGNEIFGGDVKITADKNTNSLIVTASKPDYEQVLNLLRKIDIPRDQVFVEAIIMEMAVSDGMDWDIGYYQYSADGVGKGGFNGGVNLTDMLNPTSGKGVIIPFSSGGKVTVTDPVSKNSLTIPSLTGFINWLKSTTRTNILSTPQVIAMDNQEATIEVGEKVATSVSQNTNTTGQTTFTANFEEATIKLQIKPFISPASESIRMEINQTVKQPTTPVGPAAIRDNTLPLATRAIKTNIVVSNGDTAVLGGLMKDQDREEETKVPLLGDLPIIGWLFKSRSTAKEKINLMVFLTPKIIRSTADSNRILGKKLDQRIDFIKAAGGRDPHGRQLEELNQKVAGVPSSPGLDDLPNRKPAPRLPPAPSSPPREDRTRQELNDALQLTEPPTGATPPPGSAPAPSTGELEFAPDLDFESNDGEDVPPEIIE